MTQYKKVWGKVGTHQRHTRSGQLKTIGEYDRRHRVRIDKTISPELAHQILEKQSKQKQHLFKKYKYKKYSNIIQIDTPQNAAKSIRKLIDEFREAKNKEKKLRITRVSQYTTNRINANLKRKKLSELERDQLKKVQTLYNNCSKVLWASYNKLN